MADSTDRTRFFDGQFLRARDFVAEQDYHLDRRRRHGRFLHTSGVANGLVVTGAVGSTTVTVSAGTALDEQGQEIVLPDPRALTMPTGAASVDIFISYSEAPAEPSTDPGVTGFTRTRESPNLVVVPPGTVPAGAVLLARVPVDAAEGQVNGTIDNGVRRLIGAVIADGSITEPTLANDAVSSRAIAAGAVTEPKLANDAVSARTIQNNAVGDPALGNNAVSARTLQDNAVTSRSVGPADTGTDQTLTTGSGVKTGHLKDQAVTAAKLADNAVTAAKLQSHPSDNAQRAVGKLHLQNGAVSIAQLTATLVLDSQVSVSAAPAAGQVAEQFVIIQQVDEPAFYLISVQYVGPRPAVSSALFFSSSFSWKRRTTLVKLPGPPIFFHRHELLIENPNTTAITVACKAYRVAEA